MVETIPGFGLMLAKSIAARLQQLVRLIPVPEHMKEEGGPSEEAIKLLPVELMRRHRILPLRKEGNVLTLGFVEVRSGSVLQSVRNLLAGFELRPVRIDSTLFDAAMKTHSGASGVQQPPTAQKKAESSPPVTKPSIEGLLQGMIAEGASDLHLSAGQRPGWRIHGQMHEILDSPVFDRETTFELLAPLIDKRYLAQFQETNWESVTERFLVESGSKSKDRA
jgi:hypothetical protein